jgi:hypothetical protein
MALQSIALKLGAFNEPGPGFLPFVSSLIMGILSLSYLVSGVLQVRTKKESDLNFGMHWRKAVFLVAFSFIYVSILWEKLGYLISSTIWLIVVFKMGGIQSWRKNVVLTIIIVIASYVLLEKVGNCFLPKGILDFWVFS